MGGGLFSVLLVLVLGAASSDGGPPGPHPGKGLWRILKGGCQSETATDTYSHAQWDDVTQFSRCSSITRSLADANKGRIVLGWEYDKHALECRALLVPGINSQTLRPPRGRRRSPWDSLVTTGNATTPPMTVGNPDGGILCGSKPPCLYPPSAPKCKAPRTAIIQTPPECACNGPQGPPPGSRFCASKAQFNQNGRHCVPPSTGNTCDSNFIMCVVPPPCQCDSSISGAWKDKPVYCASKPRFSTAGRVCEPSGPTGCLNPSDAKCDAPNTFVPSTRAPSTPIPLTPAPNTPTPRTPAPSTPVPTSAPNSSVPSSPTPVTSAPSTLSPITTAPGTPVPVHVQQPPVCQCESNTTINSKWFCASRNNWSSKGRKCEGVRNPGGQCLHSELKCHGPNHGGKQKFMPSGQACGCTSYLGDSKASDKVLCVGKGVCSSRNAIGSCNGTATLCSARKVLRLSILLNDSLTIDELVQKLSQATGVPTAQVAIASICPGAVCPLSVCPGTAPLRRRAGCHVRPHGTSLVQGGVSLYMDFDIMISTEVERSQVVEELFQNVDELTAGAPPGTEQQEALSMLDAQGISSVYSVDGSNDSEESSSKSWWEMYWWVVLICIATVSSAGIIVRKTVRFSDLVNFDSSRKTDDKTKLPRGMEGCYRAHRKQPRRGWFSIGRNAGGQYPAPAPEKEVCIDTPDTLMLPVTEYIKYSPLELVPKSRKGKGSSGSVRSRSTESSGSSEPEMLI